MTTTRADSCLCCAKFPFAHNSYPCTGCGHSTQTSAKTTITDWDDEELSLIEALAALGRTHGEDEDDRLQGRFGWDVETWTSHGKISRQELRISYTNDDGADIWARYELRKVEESTS